MPPEAIALVRDLALILLVIEAIVLAAPLVIVPLYAIRYLRRFRTPIRPALRRVRYGVLEVEQATNLVSSMAVQPLLWATAAADGLKRGLGHLLQRR
ncbi:MAG TPA: hypothetical protein VJ714_09725 [Anaerolineae bacterium]|jgi:hypothetical protein|nr:hypothetical protein [Anaerolineae bacterium]